MSYEREGPWQSYAQTIGVGGTESKHKLEWMYILHVSVRVYWAVGCCTNQSIAMSLPCTWRFKECLLWPKPKLTTPLHTVVQPKLLEALDEDIQQERRVRQQHRTESSKAQDDGISTRRYVRQSLVGSTMYIMDYPHYLPTSLTLKYPTAVTTTIL